MFIFIDAKEINRNKCLLPNIIKYVHLNGKVNTSHNEDALETFLVKIKNRIKMSTATIFI